MVINTSEIIKQLNWRYATKEFDTSKKLSNEQLELVFESLRLSPSSFGLQAWKFVVVSDQKLKVKLKPHAWNQSQITDASQIVVLCRLENLDKTYVKKYIEHAANTRGVHLENMKGYEQMILGGMKTKSEGEINEWMSKQVYIALGMLMANCAAVGIDACPIEGFDKKKFDEILELKTLGVTSQVVCAVGFRSNNDKYASMKKVRFDKEDIITLK
ncbi:MAG: NAD(P)H-dependent oxidoreductase [Candidatus Altiarchaeota archaeon]|nr:NAD(P)H-dependent oxidoreductase [Candidatus Altiarchaeota archaeon]